MNQPSQPVLTNEIEMLLKRGGVIDQIKNNIAVHGFKALVIASDYGGDEPSSTVHTYGFLIVSWAALRHWYKEIVSPYRSNGELGDSLMEFKKLKDGKRQRCLQDWLNLIEQIPGHLFIFSIEKALPSALGANPGELIKYLADHGYDAWDRNDAEKLWRVLLFVSLLARHATHSGQKLCWIADRDSIMGDPNEEPRKLEQLRLLFTECLNFYVNHELGSGSGIAVPTKAKPDLFFEEVISICDLFCGAVTKYWSADTEKDEWNDYWKLRAPIHRSLANHTSQLQKHLLLIKAQGSKMRVCRYEMETTDKIDDRGPT